eukprot:UN29306
MYRSFSDVLLLTLIITGTQVLVGISFNSVVTFFGSHYLFFLVLTVNLFDCIFFGLFLLSIPGLQEQPINIHCIVVATLQALTYFLMFWGGIETFGTHQQILNTVKLPFTMILGNILVSLNFTFHEWTGGILCLFGCILILIMPPAVSNSKKPGLHTNDNESFNAHDNFLSSFIYFFS